MSTLYEDELKRLIGDVNLKIENLQKQGGPSKQLKTLQDEVEVLKERLESYQKAMAHFRIKQPATPTHSQTPSPGQTT